MRRTMGIVLAVGALCSLGASAVTATGQQEHRGLEAARRATARFHRVGAAERARYGLLRDAAGVACIDNPGVGGMGDHYVNQRLVSDTTVDARRPEALVYEPRGDGRLRLVALEYIALQSAWDAGHRTPPSLFGRRFELVTAPNRFGLPAFYELHAWVWKRNPRGTFDDWNPRVTCALG